MQHYIMRVPLFVLRLKVTERINQTDILINNFLYIQPKTEKKFYF